MDSLRRPTAPMVRKRSLVIVACSSCASVPLCVFFFQSSRFLLYFASSRLDLLYDLVQFCPFSASWTRLVGRLRRLSVLDHHTLAACHPQLLRFCSVLILFVVLPFFSCTVLPSFFLLCGLAQTADCADDPSGVTTEWLSIACESCEQVADDTLVIECTASSEYREYSDLRRLAHVFSNGMGPTRIWMYWSVVALITPVEV